MFAQNMVDEQLVKCLQCDKGCEWSGKYSEYKTSHAEVCEKKEKVPPKKANSPNEIWQEELAKVTLILLEINKMPNNEERAKK